MNITTIGSIPSNNWKRIKGHYVAAAAGVALAVSAVVIGGFDRGSNVVTRSEVAVAAQRLVSQADLDAAVLSTEMATWEVSSAAPDQRAVSPGDIQASALSSDMAAYDFTAVPARRVSQADIAASVLSSELANFAVPAEHIAVHADIMASVISTELANFGQ